MSHPFFSVCVPVYNAEVYLDACLQSIMNQTEVDFEVIAVNDGSLDNSQRLIEQFSEKDSRFKLVTQDNKGLFHTRLTALEHSQGTYIVWLDADDYLETHALSYLRNLIQQSDADMVIYNHFDEFTNGSRRCGQAIFDDGHVFEGQKKELFEQFILSSQLTSIWRKAIKRHLFELDKVRHLPRITMGEDWIWSYYPMLVADRIVYTTEPLINYRILPTSLTSQYDTGWHETLSLMHDLGQQWLATVPESQLTGQVLDVKYLVDLSKALVYIPGRVKDKGAYLDMLRKIGSNKVIKELYDEQKANLSFLYRLPFILLYSSFYHCLLQLKRLSAILRKRK
ncbi:glycosyltransferase family 2 protein [Streptococcus sp. E24BD]|uniref:glycosyltransferase family 2 protein n=1 Tax=Streptococcus sp. E24BD TaxID=3278715 RepID=UPI00359D4E4A